MMGIGILCPNPSVKIYVEPKPKHVTEGTNVSVEEVKREELSL